MPATNFSWPGEDRQQIFQVFGTKRKPCEDSTEQMYEDDMNRLVTKRLCTETDRLNSIQCDEEDMMESGDSPIVESQPAATGGQILNLPVSSESHTCLQNANSQQHIQLWNDRVPPLPDHTRDHVNSANNNDNSNISVNTELNNNSEQQSYNQQDDMIMDLNDGLYSMATFPGTVTTDAEYEAACSMVAAMEGDGVPNPQQYRMSYCDQYCSGGHTSPSSGKVRCCCKPSWEGLQDMRPYVSDYY